MSEPASGSRDFDFEIGRWVVSHRRLRSRLVGCLDWDEFTGTAEMRPILGGLGNVEDNVLDMPGGTYRAVAIRSFDPESGLWAIWWLSTSDPHRLDVPVVGQFVEGVGTFYADEEIDGRSVRTRFLWTDTATLQPRWEQAMSVDGGRTWETNWTMVFRRPSA